MRRLLLVPLLLLGLPMLAPGAVGPSAGVVDPHGLVRYVAVPAGSATVVEKKTVRGGRIVLSRALPGRFGVPVVTADGTTEGVSHDGRTLVLATNATRGSTRFAVLGTKDLKLQRLVALRGSFTYDALSPNGRTLYVIEHSLGTNPVRYRVRAYAVVAGRLLPGTIADKSSWGKYMRGTPMTRVTSGDGGWVYTLYGKPDGTAFVHALDARHRSAVCVDLPWRHTTQSIASVTLSLARGQLVLSQPRAGTLAMIDTASFAVRTYGAPKA
jgi:hypothetical protein